MPLGMMAKDSIQDFTLLGSEAEDRLTEIPHDRAENAVADNNNNNHGGLAVVASKMELLSNKIPSSNSDDATTSSAGGDSCCSAASPANPQQAQEEENDEEDEDGEMMKSRSPPSFLPQQQQQQQNQQQQQYAGFKSDYWSQHQYNSKSKNHKPNSFQNMKNSAYGAYDSSYFYDPYATTSTSTTSGAQRAAGSNNSMYLLGRDPQEQQLTTLFRCLLPCLFPWQQGPPPTSHHAAGLPLMETHETAEASAASDQQEKDVTIAASTTTAATRETAGAAVEDDEKEEVASNASETLGEKLSDRDRQAVLARLRLAQPEVEDETPKTGTAEHSGESDPNGGGVGSNDNNAAGNSSSSKVQNSSTNNQGLLSEVPPPKPIKGILKKRATLAKGNQGAQAAAAAGAASTASLGSDGTGDGGGGSKNKAPPGGPRRSLFPQYSYDSYGPPGDSNNSGDLGDMASSASGGGQQLRGRTKRHATFSPMARVMTVKSKNEMTAEEKGDIWWVKSDYEDFRKAGRIISRAMAEGGSEIWLAFSRSCRAAAKKKKLAERVKMSIRDGGNGKLCSDEVDDDDDDGDKDILAISADKWWHEFGHSRRGLEHVVSIEEGRQRQQNVRNAIQAVLEEQARQKLYRRLVDSEKLRKISLQYTSWARDLALASGSSDADAVKSSFSDSRKSREFYLSELITSNNNASSSSISSSVAPKSTSAANTASTTTAVTIPDFMRASSLQQSPAVRQTIAAPTADLLDANTAAQIRYRRKKTKDAVADKKAATLTSEEPVHDGPLSSIISNIDDVSSSKPESMAHRAAGFSAEGDAKISAAAVLSGMGAVSSGAISTAC